MKRTICSLILVFVITACNDKEKNTTDFENPDPSTFTEDSIEGGIDAVRNPFLTERDNAKAVKEPIETPEAVSGDFSGRYKKIKTNGGNNDLACNCDCLNINFNSSFELCLIPDKMYINAISKKTGDGTAGIFLVSPAKVQNLEQDLPWNNFDRNTPIATVDLQPDGSLKMDWKGFSIDGELAADYAIFGKKALEGTYKKE